MTFANIDALLVLGTLVFTGTLWMLVRPTPVRVRKNQNRR